MAPPPVPLVTVGEFVRHNDRTWQVTDIVNTVGWNQYHLVDIDTGESVVRARYQLDTIPFLDIMAPDEDFELEIQVTHPEMAPTSNSEPSSRQWNDRSDADLDRLQESRHSKSTGNQTKWASKIFRGTSAIAGSKQLRFCALPSEISPDKPINYTNILSELLC